MGWGHIEDIMFYSEHEVILQLSYYHIGVQHSVCIEGYVGLHPGCRQVDKHVELTMYQYTC